MESIESEQIEVTETEPFLGPLDIILLVILLAAAAWWLLKNKKSNDDSSSARSYSIQ